MKKLSEQLLTEITFDKIWAYFAGSYLDRYTLGLALSYVRRVCRNNAEQVALLEQVVEAAKRAIAIIYDVGYAAIPTAIDLEEAIDRLEDTNAPR